MTFCEADKSYDSDELLDANVETWLFTNHWVPKESQKTDKFRRDLQVLWSIKETMGS